jgi:antitoxin MazE
MLLLKDIKVMMKNLIKHGNSHALVIDKAVLDLLKIDPACTPLELTTDGNVLLVTPVREKRKQKELAEVLKKIDRQYGPVFKRLADR